MSARFPKQVTLTPFEAERINRIEIAKMYGITPAQVDAMPESDYRDTLEYLWAKDQINEVNRALRKGG